MRSTSPWARSGRRAVGLAVTACLVTALGLAGCDRLSRQFRKQGTQTLKARDGRSEIQVPRGWKPASGINEQASIQAQRIEQASFLLVLTENKQDFAPFSLKKYSALVRGMMKGKAETYAEVGPVELSVGPHRALQYDLRLSSMGFGQRMLHTCVEGPRYAHQILLWTSVENWSRQLPRFRKIVATFRELEGPAARPAPSPDRVVLKRLGARDGSATLEVPAAWESLPKLSPVASIGAGHSLRNRYAVVVSDAKAQAPDLKTLDLFAERVMTLLAKNIPGLTVTPPVRLTIGGRPAIRREARGSLEGVHLVYLMTLVDGPTHYHQVLLWSTRTDWPVAKPLFERVAATFRLAAPAAK